ncbi:coproporphyrinogen-III oxidase family protein [Streptomyces flavofungini]|uniref:Heme chaperone HemW n=1 Tax=Streptomyces flavofungini TaxID=68200 RepID=A0ABS0XGR4_9ACTN|nr:coproporphyrinogen-III oxidase family protein [Streptomyces flavofungini]MBJ3812375.1 coproporphyrinogen III oxidase family protein [Streptomyces flavofungini]GHC88121.1 coproporphyrinogen III oxidase [Streptomyces flavofungini]
MTTVAATATPYPVKYTTPFLLYPPTLWENTLGDELVTEHLGMDEQGEDYVLYLSVPFCRVRCHSCPYFIELLSIHDSRNKEERYVDALVADLRRWAGYRRWSTGKLRSVYIGGGTGTILETKHLKKIVDTIFECFPVVQDCEVTLEGNARDYDEEKLDFVASSQITRVSLGVQSFDPALLKVIGSPHGAQESIEVIRALNERGFTNIQMDMMYNLPGHSRKTWQSDLEQLRDLDIKHLTTYLYRIHEGTPQDRFIQGGKVPPPVDKESSYVKNMYLDLIDAAEGMGFNMYMFDHFARPGWENVYNEWTFKQDVEVLGVGPGAYGFVNGQRIGSAKNVEGYIEAVDTGRHPITAASAKLDAETRRERYVINVLQYLQVEFDGYFARFGTRFEDDFAPTVHRLLERGLAELREDRLVLTELGRDWHMNVMIEFTNPRFWGDTSAPETPHWSMNTPMVDLFSGRREDWIG